jgi:hypothetical protein
MSQQRYRVLEALRSSPTGVTSRQFSHDFDIERAAARIQELRDEGYAIDTVRDPDVEGRRRYRFVLRAEPEQAGAPPPRRPVLFEVEPGHVSRSAITGREIAA